MTGRSPVGEWKQAILNDLRLSGGAMDLSTMQAWASVHGLDRNCPHPFNEALNYLLETAIVEAVSNGNDFTVRLAS